MSSFKVFWVIKRMSYCCLRYRFHWIVVELLFLCLWPEPLKTQFSATHKSWLNKLNSRKMIYGAVNKNVLEWTLLIFNLHHSDKSGAEKLAVKSLNFIVCQLIISDIFFHDNVLRFVANDTKPNRICEFFMLLIGWLLHS